MRGWKHSKTNVGLRWSKLSSSSTSEGSTSPEADVVKWKFQDGTELDVKQEEHSVSQIRSRYSIAHRLT